MLDDINHEGVKKALKYVRLNYKHWEYVHESPCSATMATFRKTGIDEREWNFHKTF
jgi:hypothetical protein